MFGFLWPVGSPQDEQPLTAGADVLQFSAEKVIEAIRFHLLDSRAAAIIDRQSCIESVERICRRPGRITIRRDRWVEMTDVERLNWLLDNSRTAVVFQSDGVAMLLGKL